MNARKWIHPKTGEVRVYLNGFKGDSGSIKAFATANEKGTAVVTVTGNEFTTDKMLENVKADIRRHYGLYESFDTYLAACAESTSRNHHAYGSKYANAYELHTGCAWDED